MIGLFLSPPGLKRWGVLGSGQESTEPRHLCAGSAGFRVDNGCAQVCGYAVFLRAHQEIDHAGTDAPRGIRFNPNPRKQELRGELVHFGTGLDHGHKIGKLLGVLAKTRRRRYPQSFPKLLQNGRKELNKS